MKSKDSQQPQVVVLSGCNACAVATFRVRCKMDHGKAMEFELPVDSVCRS